MCTRPFLLQSELHCGYGYVCVQVLQGIRLIKFYAWEDFYSHQIGMLRKREIRTIGKAA